MKSARKPIASDMSASVYLDHAATAPLAPGVAEVMHEALVAAFGNPSSRHGPGAVPARWWMRPLKRWPR